MAPRGLEIRGTLEQRLRGCLHARGAGRAGSPGASGCRSQGLDVGAHGPAGRPGPRAAPHHLPRSCRDHRPHLDQRPGCPRRPLRGQRDPGGPAAAVDPGHGPGGSPGRIRRNQPAQRRLRAAVRRRRLDVRRRGRARAGVHDVAREPAEPQAGHRSRAGVHGGRRAGGRRDEQMGGGVPRPPDHRGLAAAARLHDQDLPGPRPAPGRPSRAHTLRPRLAAPASPPRSPTRPSTWPTTTRRCGGPAHRWSSTCRRSRRRKRRRSGTTS